MALVECVGIDFVQRFRPHRPHLVRVICARNDIFTVSRGYHGWRYRRLSGSLRLRPLKPLGAGRNALLLETVQVPDSRLGWWLSVLSPPTTCTRRYHRTRRQHDGR